ncbi:serine/threonine-protein kinase [Streptomyces sp. NPDC054855]
MQSQAGTGPIIGGRYQIVTRLGSGGFGTTWKAQDVLLNVEVVLREVPLSGSATADSGVVAQVKQNARQFAQLRYRPDVVSVFDVLVDSGRLWIVTEWVEGTYLEQLLQEGPVPNRQVERLARDLLVALQAAHVAGVVHGDIRPANILQTESRKFVLSGFVDVPLSLSLGAPVPLGGGPEYVAPELLEREEPASAAGDLFSLGATLYQAVEGYSPFRRSSTVETAAAVMFEEPRPVQRADRPLALLIHALLAKDPRERPSIAQALQALDGIFPQPTRAEADPTATQGVAHPPSAAASYSVHHPLGLSLAKVAVLVSGISLLLAAGVALGESVSEIPHEWFVVGLLVVLWAVLIARGVSAALHSQPYVRQRQAPAVDAATSVRTRRARSFWEGFTDVGSFSDVRSLVPPHPTRHERLRLAYNELGPPPGLPPTSPLREPDQPRSPAPDHDPGTGGR